jgi:hypothetical protein
MSRRRGPIPTYNFNVIWYAVGDLKLHVFLVSIRTHFLVLFWSGDGPSWGRNWSLFNKHKHKSVLVVTAVFYIVLLIYKAAHSLCTATGSAVDIKEGLTETAVGNWLHGAECCWRGWQVLSWSTFHYMNKIWWTVQIVKLITNQHLPLAFPVCPLPHTTCTYPVHSN